MSETHNIKCRKCGGSHLTIKCGKEQETTEINKEPLNHNIISPKNNIMSSNTKQQNFNKSSSYNKPQNENYKSNDYKQYNNYNNKTNDYKQHNNHSNKTNDYKTNDYKSNNKQFNNYEMRKCGKVKMSNLPKDITNEELNDLLVDWGYIKYINIKQYTDDTVAYIEFKDEKQADYLIEALHNTPFDSRIIKINKLE